MLENIKILLDVTDNSKDRLLELLIDQCTEEVRQLTHQDLLCFELQATIQKMVVWQFSKLGSEGKVSESFNGISASYESDYPASIYRIINKYKKIRTL